MKNKVNAIFFWISFIPYVLLVVYSLKSAVYGISFLDSMLYGVEAYSTYFIFTFFRLWHRFTACLIYQIIVLLIEKFRCKAKIKPYILGMCIIYLLGNIILLFEGF